MSRTNNVIDIIEAGIRAENLRQIAISNNIANLETPDYRRVDVKFEEFLSKCLKTGNTVDLNKIVPELYRPKKTPVKENGNDVNYEGEVGQMIKNSIRHKALVRLLSKKYKQIELAIQTP
ncbi:MAG: flagellar basal body rod protein FlgB [Sedimentisphaerales bacterium]|nr:flagellar basal body rod protein FlgB [Sedimentisphaerales bacterium]